MLIKELFFHSKPNIVLSLLWCCWNVPILFQIMFGNQSRKLNTIVGIILDLQLDICSSSSLFSLNSIIFHNMELNFKYLIIYNSKKGQYHFL